MDFTPRSRRNSWDAYKIMRELSLIKKYWLPLTVIMLCVISFLSLSPLETLPPVAGSDKSHHFIAYAFLMLPTALRKPPKWQLWAVFFIAYGGVIELIQPYVNRYGEWLDLLANSTGILCGIVLAHCFHFFSTKSN